MKPSSLLESDHPTKLRIVKSRSKGSKPKNSILMVPGPNDNSLRYKIQLENSSGGKDTEEEDEEQNLP